MSDQPRLRRREQLVLCEAHVPVQEHRKVAEPRRVAALRRCEVGAQQRVLLARALDQLTRPGRRERQQKNLFLDGEVRRQLPLERLAHGVHELGAAGCMLPCNSTREDERVVVVGRQAMEARIALHRAKATSTAAPRPRRRR